MFSAWLTMLPVLGATLAGAAASLAPSPIRAFFTPASLVADAAVAEAAAAAAPTPATPLATPTAAGRLMPIAEEAWEKGSSFAGRLTPKVRRMPLPRTADAAVLLVPGIEVLPPFAVGAGAPLPTPIRDTAVDAAAATAVASVAEVVAV